MHCIVAIVIAVIVVFIILIYVAQLHNVFVVVDIAVHISSWSIGFDIDRYHALMVDDIDEHGSDSAGKSPYTFSATSTTVVVIVVASKQ